MGEAFTAGQSLDELAARFAVKRGTIIQNLQRYSDAGNRLDADRLYQCSKLSANQRQQALAVFDKLGHERLGPVHEALGGSISYDELHLLRLWLACQA